MTYNIHPLFVHFPIALLFVYSIIKILPLQKWFPVVTWKHIERALLLVGVLGAFAALSTGEIAEHLTRPNHDLVEAHALFATTATWMYGLLLIGEILSVAMSWMTTKITSLKTLKVITFVKDLLTHPILSTTLAVLGLITISIAGLLGGVMVYGTSADPIAGTVLKILGIDF
jgi:uncharacterized membrane protein